MQEYEARVEQLLSETTLAEKVGQMTQIHMDVWGQSEGEERIRRGQVGSVLTIYGASKINRLQRLAAE